VPAKEAEDVGEEEEEEEKEEDLFIFNDTKDVPAKEAEDMGEYRYRYDLT
jgi:hypothetical protein